MTLTTHQARKIAGPHLWAELSEDERVAATGVDLETLNHCTFQDAKRHAENGNIVAALYVERRLLADAITRAESRNLVERIAATQLTGW